MGTKKLWIEDLVRAWKLCTMFDKQKVIMQNSLCEIMTHFWSFYIWYGSHILRNTDFRIYDPLTDNLSKKKSNSYQQLHAYQIDAPSEDADGASYT